MPASTGFDVTPLPDGDELSVEDAVLNTWIEDTGVYLRLDGSDSTPTDEPPPDYS